MLQALFFFLVPFRTKKSEIQRGFRQERQAWMAERSKALDSSSSLFGGVGSNPIPSIPFFFLEWPKHLAPVGLRCR